METNWHKNAEVEKKELYFSFHRSRNICISTDRLKDTFVQESEKREDFLIDGTKNLSIIEIKM